MMMMNCTIKTTHAVPLASVRQHTENQKENQAGHSPERAVVDQVRHEAPGLKHTDRNALRCTFHHRNAHRSPKPPRHFRAHLNSHGDFGIIVVVAP